MGGAPSSPSKVAAGLALVALIQLLFVLFANNIFDLFRESIGTDTSLSKPPSPRRGKGSLVIKNGRDNHGATIKTEYPCFPPRYRHHSRAKQRKTVVYLETAYVNLHYETYYTYIHKICSCDPDKDPHWTIDNGTVPHFYVGPPEMSTRGFERVLREYNTTTCGPIFFGTPRDPDLTIVTTSYPRNFEPGHERGYRDLIDDKRYIFICHEDAPSLEDATNVFFLTPLHERYVVPSFFPPSLVRRHSKSLYQRNPRERSPVFLVIGSFNSRFKRNVRMLQYPLRSFRDRNFTVRFLGGGSDSTKEFRTNDRLTEQLRSMFPDGGYERVEFLPRTDTDEFMVRVSESDVILPLVDGGPFYHYDNGYQGGKKLTSSVMWGLGFGKKMVLYRPLAEAFGIREDNVTYFLHGDPTLRVQPFHDAFGRCLDVLEREGGGR